MNSTFPNILFDNDVAACWGMYVWHNIEDRKYNYFMGDCLIMGPAVIRDGPISHFGISKFMHTYHYW